MQRTDLGTIPGLCAKGQVNSGAYPGQLTVTKQYKFGTDVSWEGNRRSGVALAMRHRHRGLSTYGLNGQRQGDEHPRLCLSGHGTIYLTKRNRCVLTWSSPCTYRGQIQPTCAFHTTTDPCQTSTRSIDIWENSGCKTCFWPIIDDGLCDMDVSNTMCLKNCRVGFLFIFSNVIFLFYFGSCVRL